ncbi:hypothetical protein JW865_07000 [Candidatus Bathyarchaeota archaeon]|nr:hypothetical protein [Candidatus Bathyarchaeota archaeon]
MEVFSRPKIPIIGDKGFPLAIPGQRLVYLISVDYIQKGSIEGVEISATATISDANIIINNTIIKLGEISEIIIIPESSSVNKILTITIVGKVNGFNQTKKVSVEVIDREDQLKETAIEIREKFTSWLIDNETELGITNETEWVGTIVNPRVLVVMHYMFYSNEWEMYLTWHATIPPNDWAKIYLRPRFVESNSFIAYEISSLIGEEKPHPIEPPEWI